MGGGVFTYLVDLANELVHQYDIYIAYGIRKQTPENYKEYFDTAVHLIHVKNFTREISPRKDISALFEITRIAKEVQPDIIHLHSSKAGVLGRIAFNGKKISLFYTPHGYSFLMQGASPQKRKIYKMIELFFGRWNCTTIACSAGEYEEAKRITKHALCVNNGVNITELQNLIDQNGQYTIYSSWSGILSIFLTLNLAYGSFQTAMVKFEDQRDEYIMSIQGICIVLCCVFLVIYFPIRSVWNQLFELPTSFVLLMVAEIIFSTATQLWMGEKRFEFKYKSVVLVTLLTSILSPIIALILIRLVNEKGYARIFGYAIINILIGLVLFVRSSQKGKHFYNKEFWKYAVGFNVPLLAYYLSQVIFNQSDRIMISHMLGTGEAAMYGVAYNLATILTFVLNAIDASYVPWMYEKIKENKSSENEVISLVLVILMGLMVLCVIWYAPEIIMIMAGEQYKEAVYVVAPVAMSLFLLFYCQLFINVELYYEEKKLLIYGSIGASLLNIVLNYILIPTYGFVAAGYTTLASYIVFALSNYYTMRICLKKRQLIDNLYNYKGLFLISIGFIASGFLGVALYGNLFFRIAITLIILSLLVVYRSKFLDVLRQIRSK